MERPLRKPNWMTSEDWRQLLDLNNGAPRCTACGTTKDLSVDHIVPRIDGGLNEVGNYQFMCIPHNSGKGPRPDAYWSRQFYWDQMPDLDQMRTAQRAVFDTIVSDPDASEWFSGGFQADRTGRIYLLAWVVGAGKTLGVPSVAFAMNHLLRREWGATRRADRILVLTKEQAIRDQLARDLTDDLVRYGIAPHRPRVAVIERGDQLNQREWLDQHDLVVSCVQQLWERNGQASALASVLDYFPLIFIDEPHFGPDQVRKIVGSAHRSLVFGLTGTPVSGTGKLLDDFVLLSLFTYQDAVDNDRSLKRVSANPNQRDVFVKEVAVASADLMSRGSVTHVDGTGGGNYDARQLEPVQNVVEATVRHMTDCDLELSFVGQDPAEHRETDEEAAADLWFPAHGLISCETVELARRLCDSANAMFDADRQRYPRARGWRAEVVHSDVDAIDKSRVKGARLTTDHPWMRAKSRYDAKRGIYTADDKCARLLLVVGMAREGVNNPLCSVVGVTSPANSLVEIVQRAIGRQLRTPTWWDPINRVLHVPPAKLDTIRIVVHQEADPRGIDRAIRYVCDMGKDLEGLPTIASLVAGAQVSPQSESATAIEDLTLAERYAIAEYAGAVSLRDGLDWRSTADAIEEVTIAAAARFAPQPGERQDRVAEWVDVLRYAPDEAWRRVHPVPDIAQIPAVTTIVREDERHEPTPPEMDEFLRKHHPDLAGPLTEGESRFARRLYAEWAARYVLPITQNMVPINKICGALAASVLHDLWPYIPDGDPRKGAKEAANKLVRSAVKQLLGVPDGEPLSDNSKWDTPQCHVIVQRPDSRRKVEGWVRAKLIRGGFCPRLAAGFEAEPL